MEIEIRIPSPEDHPKQLAFIRSKAKRKIIRAGRRGGKTIGVSILAIEKFLEKRRILYAAPTAEQTGIFWRAVCNSLNAAIRAGVLCKNETERYIEVPGTENRIKAKTAWNADTLRGDYADVLILDEFQLMDEETWDNVGVPMLLDNDGDAVFIYTPPSLRSRSVSKARDPQHAAKMYLKAKADTSGRWEAFHFTSMDNPHISSNALGNLSGDMTALAYRMEILAEDVNEVPGALWKREMVESHRVHAVPELSHIVVGVDPSATSTGDDAGIIVAGKNGRDGYVLADRTVQGSPLRWAEAAVAAYYTHKADRIIAEANQGGEMVSLTIAQVDRRVPVKLVHASRGKRTRAEPIAAQYEQGRIHHVGKFDQLEDEMCLWLPGDPSPNRMDAMVWALTELLNPQGMPGAFVVGGKR